MWSAAAEYDRFMGRWSREVAQQALAAMHVPAGARWLDVGCGTGPVVAAITEFCDPSVVVGVDPSADFIRVAKRQHRPSVRFQQAVAEQLPFEDGSFDATVSGLMLNFTDDPAAALAEMVRVTRPGGTVVTYVWDYDHPGFFLTLVWKTLEESFGGPAAGDERGRWTLCSPSGLRDLAAASPLVGPAVWTIEVDTPLTGSDELWEGLLWGLGPSGAAVTGLPPEHQAKLRTRLEANWPDDVAELTARAIAVRGTAP